MTPAEIASMIELEARSLVEDVCEHEDGPRSCCMRGGMVGRGSTGTAIAESCRKMRRDLLVLQKMIGGE